MNTHKFHALAFFTGHDDKLDGFSGNFNIKIGKWKGQAERKGRNRGFLAL
jgi:hypothetical protein